MGWWGYYDDENDSTADVWIGLCEHFFKNNRSVNYIIDYMGDHENRFYHCLFKYLKKLYKRDPIQGNFIVPGVCLTLFKLLNDLPIQGRPFTNIPPPAELPAVPKDFPNDIALLVVSCLTESMKILENECWANPNDRKGALNHEMYLFSRGNRGESRNIIPNSFELFWKKDTE